MATDTAGMLDALGVNPAHLAGVSLGGMICQLLGLGQPDRVLSLTLISTSPGPSDARLSPPSAAIAEVALREATTPEQRDQRTLDLVPGTER
jgi:pimeloyl-ACP methyl ester carboxylesterase